MALAAVVSGESPFIHVDSIQACPKSPTIPLHVLCLLPAADQVDTQLCIFSWSLDKSTGQQTGAAPLQALRSVKHWKEADFCPAINEGLT